MPHHDGTWKLVGDLRVATNQGDVQLLAGGYQLLRSRHSYSTAHRLVLIALMAALAGRLLEQMVGLAKVSDLTIFWVILGIFVALPGLMRQTRSTQWRQASVEGFFLARRIGRLLDRLETIGTTGNSGVLDWRHICFDVGEERQLCSSGRRGWECCERLWPR